MGIEERLRRGIGDWESGHIVLIGRVIRDGYISDPYWFFSPTARWWCGVGGLADINWLYKRSLEGHPDLPHLPLTDLNEHEYKVFRRALEKKD